jgi:K+-sensing histidine kinase KdpD
MRALGWIGVLVALLRTVCTPPTRSTWRRSTSRLGCSRSWSEDLQTVALADAGSLTLAREPTDHELLVDEALVAFATRPSTPGVRLTSDIEPDLPVISLDSARIRQVLANLLSNAIRHVPP